MERQHIYLQDLAAAGPPSVVPSHRDLAEEAYRDTGTRGVMAGLIGA